MLFQPLLYLCWGVLVALYSVESGFGGIDDEWRRIISTGVEYEHKLDVRREPLLTRSPDPYSR